ncbi:MAG: hypothetical protein ACE5HJ_05895 [Thermoplasmata archaeon]
MPSDGLRIPPTVVRLLRGIALTVVIIAAVLGALFAFARTWPPTVVVQSGSMQHSNETSFLGVVDTGDIVVVQDAPTPRDVITYVEGRARGYGTYGDYGDVILFQSPEDAMPIIHRPIFRLLWNDTAEGFDIPSLLDLEQGVDWDSNRPTPLGLQAGDSVVLHNISFRDLSIEFSIGGFTREVIAPRCIQENPCYVTMGDNNAPNYDQTLVRHSWVVGRARGEIPWLGLLSLLLGGTYRWGDSRVPANSWTYLGIVLLLWIGVPVAWAIVRSVRGQVREPSEGADEGGLGPVLSVLEERWRRRGGQEAKGEESEADETSPPNTQDQDYSE